MSDKNEINSHENYQDQKFSVIPAENFLNFSNLWLASKGCNPQCKLEKVQSQKICRTCFIFLIIQNIFCLFFSGLDFQKVGLKRTYGGNSIVYRNSKLWNIIIWLLCIISSFCLWNSIIWWYCIIFIWKKLWLSIIWFYDDFPSYYDFPSYDDYAS